MTLAGVEFRIIDLGPGESSDITVIHISAADALIGSDLVCSHCYPWLAEHRVDTWLAQIDRVLATFPYVATVHAGHGPAGGTDLLTAQHDYINEFRAVVAHHTHADTLDEAAIAAIRTATMRGREKLASRQSDRDERRRPRERTPRFLEDRQCYAPCLQAGLKSTRPIEHVIAMRPSTGERSLTRRAPSQFLRHRSANAAPIRTAWCRKQFLLVSFAI